MKSKKSLIILFIFSLFCMFGQNAFADDTSPKPYNIEEFPQGFKDLRRFEIITFGSLPFVTLDVTLAYTGYEFVKNDFNTQYLPNIFAKDSYTKEQQVTIILTSLGISAGIGLTDYIINLVKRSNIKKRNNYNKKDNLKITPLDQNPEAVKIPKPEQFENNTVEEETVIDVEEID